MIYKKLQFSVEMLSGEWMLTRLKKANGGTIIILRSAQVSVVIFLLSILLINVFDPHKSWLFSLPELQIEIKNKIPWLGAIFTVVYASLYSRFSSQWQYLSGLYNSIKEAQTSNASYCKNTMAEWKAGFIEDAEYLHIATKRSFAPIIHDWGKDPDVIECFSKHTPGGDKWLPQLMDSVEKSCDSIKKRYE
jgi:hypothetical protein